MIIAELKGKLSSKLEDKEDILTSNVFSFFKYSDRQLLKDYLSLLGINVTLSESNSAEFLFWPVYDDRTEPDIVIVCGKYYILFEAKLYSDFSPKTSFTASQIEREINMGVRAAKNINKDFIYIALTAEYYKNQKKFKKYENRDYLFKWTNWQLIASFLSRKLEGDKLIQDKKFAFDLYSLLVKKKLRCYRGISDLEFLVDIPLNDFIYYSINTSKYKGNFSGFLTSLDGFEEIMPYQNQVEKYFFNNLILYNHSDMEKVFYNGK